MSDTNLSEHVVAPQKTSVLKQMSTVSRSMPTIPGKMLTLGWEFWTLLGCSEKSHEGFAASRAGSSLHPCEIHWDKIHNGRVYCACEAGLLQMLGNTTVPCAKMQILKLLLPELRISLLVQRGHSCWFIQLPCPVGSQGQKPGLTGKGSVWNREKCSMLCFGGWISCPITRFQLLLLKSERDPKDSPWKAGEAG